MVPAGFEYQAFYCEENIWRLCLRAEFRGECRHAVFLASPRGYFPMARQTLAETGELVWWDYHVVHLELGASPVIRDFDSRLDFPADAVTYLDASFGALPEGVAPRFRPVAADFYARDFSSDRSHMRSPDGDWLEPPPTWPRPGLGAGNLAAYLDLDSSEKGPWLTLAAFGRFVRA